MPDQENIQLFEDQPIRTIWNTEEEEWYFSIVDVVGVLTKQTSPTAPDDEGADMQSQEDNQE